jgi:similar to stage IV sporulation protein
MQTKDGYEFNISVQGFKQLRQVVRKTKTRPFIIKRYGLPFILHRYRKRKIFFISVAVCCFIIYILSLFIWEIDVSGEMTHTDEAIIKYLKEIDVYTGVQKSKVSCQEIEEDLRAKYTDIGWVSAEIRGTRLLIKITESNIPKEKEVQTENCHIIATKNGIVKSIVTRYGTPLVKVGSVVKKNDILVSGIIDVIGDGDQVVAKEPTIADADIILKTYYDYYDEFDINYIKKEYTGREKKSYAMSVFGRKIFLYTPFKKYDKYDIIVNDEKLRIGDDFYLPASVSKICYKEYTETPATYTTEELIKIANDNLKLFIDKLIEKGVSIIENNVRIEVSGTKCVTSGKLIVEEKAVAYQEIDDSEWRNLETDEHSGNDD